MEYHIGDKVIFTDGFGNEQVGTITSLNAFEMEGMLAIDVGSYGVYVRDPAEVRLTNPDDKGMA